jgi:hypothetical protein
MKRKLFGMRSVLCFILLIFSLQGSAQKTKKLHGKPSTLDETYLYLNEILSDTAKYSFMTLPADYSTAKHHMGLGLWIRNSWGLWRGGKLERYLSSIGVMHADYMSSFILASYHCYLNKKPISIEGKPKPGEKLLLKRGDTIISPSDILKGYTSDSMLLQYFPVGDTIFVNVYATKWILFYPKPSGVQAFAVVKEHRPNANILVEIISFRNRGKLKPQRKVGEVFETRLYYCDLVPPAGWKFTPRE